MHGCVVGASVRQSEWVTGSTSRDICMLSSMSEVSIPLLMPRSKVLNLSKTNKTKNAKYIFKSLKERKKGNYNKL